MGNVQGKPNEGCRQTLECSNRNVEQLSNFVTEVHSHVKLKHSKAELVRHEAHIRTHIVQPICDKLSKIHPALTVSDVYLNGSIANQTKIEAPNEIDYVLPIVYSDHVEITKGKDELSGDSYECRVHRSVYKQLNQCSRFTDSNGLLDSKHFTEKILQNAVKESLLELNLVGKLIFKGEIELKDVPIESSKLRYNEVQLDRQLNAHGPSICLRVGGLLCVTNIDLCFCLKMIEQPPHSESSFFMVVPARRYWVRSYYASPNELIQKLDKHHRKIVMTLKYILSQVRRHNIYSRFHSHVLFTLVRYHQAQCGSSGISLGKCFLDVSHRLCKLQLRPIENNRFVEFGETLNENIIDIECPENSLLIGGASKYFTFPLVLHILTKLKTSNICTLELNLNCVHLIDIVIRECWLEFMKQLILNGAGSEKLTSNERNAILSAENVLLVENLKNQYGITLEHNPKLFDVERILSRLKEQITLPGPYTDIETWKKTAFPW